MLNLFVFPMFLGLLEYGRLVMVRQLMTNAAREGARMAVVGTASNPPVTTAQIQAAVLSYLSPMGQPLSDLSVSVQEVDPVTGNPIGPWTQASYGGVVAVKITGGYTPVVPGLSQLGGGTLQLQTVSVMLSEAN